MKLHVIVAPRHDLDFIIEEEYTDIKSNISVYDLVSELAQTPNLTEKSITVIVDGKVVPFADWKKYFLSEEKNHEIYRGYGCFCVHRYGCHILIYHENDAQIEQ